MINEPLLLDMIEGKHIIAKKGAQDESGSEEPHIPCLEGEEHHLVEAPVFKIDKRKIRP